MSRHYKRSSVGPTMTTHPQLAQHHNQSQTVPTQQTHRATTAKMRLDHNGSAQDHHPEEYSTELELIQEAQMAHYQGGGATGRQVSGHLGVSGSLIASDVITHKRKQHFSNNASAANIHNLVDATASSNYDKVHMRFQTRGGVIPQVRCGSATGSAPGYAYASGAAQVNAAEVAGAHAYSQYNSTNMPQGAAQQSGKAFFGKRSMAGDEGAESDVESNKKEKKNLEQLLDSMWPKDPLSEHQKQETNFGREIIEIGEFFEGVSRDQNHLLTMDGEIKQSLNRIKDTEIKLGDMISRHIKKRGVEKFSNSNFVVTNRQNFKNPSSQARNETGPRQFSSMKRSSQRNLNKSENEELEKTRKLRGAKKTKSLTVQERLNGIMDSGRQAIAPEKKVHQLGCFRPREIFNINTHALFQKDKLKDPLDSEDSEDDEEEIIFLLQNHKEQMDNNSSGMNSDAIKNAKIDLNAYDPNKPIDYNSKMIRSMINRAKQATDTNRTASMAQNRKEQLKMSKFIKKDSSHLKQSKIARETSEAIKYLNKRQPLAVQNSKQVADDQLFSKTSDKRISISLQKEQTTTALNSSVRDNSQSPPRQNFQLQHAGQKAKFFRNIGGPQQSHQIQMNPSQIISDTTSLDTKSFKQVHQRGYTSSQVNFNTKQLNMMSSKKQPQKQLSQTKQAQMSRSGSRSRFQNYPSTYKTARGTTVGNNKQLQQQALIQTQQTNQQRNISDASTGVYAAYEEPLIGASKKPYMHIHSGSLDIGGGLPFADHAASSAGLNQPASFQNINIQSFNPVVQVSNPTYTTNNITVVSDAGSKNQTQRMRAKRMNTEYSLNKRAVKTNRNKSQKSLGMPQRKQIPKKNVTARQIRSIVTEPQPLNFHPQTKTNNAEMQSISSSQPAILQQNSRIQTVDGRISTAQQLYGVQSFDAAEAMARINETVESKSFGNASFISMQQQQQMPPQPWVSNQGELPNQASSVQFTTNSLARYGSNATGFQTTMNRKKSSAVVKVDQTILEKMPTLGVMEMLRILDARNEDMGLKKQINVSDCTPDGLDKLIIEFAEGQGQGPAQRFRDYCEQKCVNRKLVLQDFSLGPMAAAEIASILAVNREIVHIDLSKNNLQDEGVQALTQVIKNNTAIIHLDLMQNNITTKGSKKIFKALASNISLISLKMGNVENVNKNKLGVKAVPKLNAFIKSSQVLSFLDIRSTNLTDAGLVALCDGLIGNKTLFCLNLSKNDITSSGLETFAPMLHTTAIRELDMSLNPLGNTGIRIIAENLFELITDKRRNVTVKRGKKSALRKLNLAETKFQEQGGYHLFKQLIDFSSMQTLILDYNQFESKNTTMLCNFIKQSKINRLSLNYCKLGDAGGVAIGEALSQSLWIKELCAKRNEFRDATAKAMAEAIEENSTIEYLDLSNNLINDSGGELIGLALAVNVRLRHLNLRKNNLRVTSGAMFAQSMKENKTLKCVRLEKNSININFLESIDAYIKRNNIEILSHHVENLRSKRQGYVNTRVHDWHEVKVKTTECSSKIRKLEHKVHQKEHSQEKLGEEIDQVSHELHANLDNYKNNNRSAKETLDELNIQFRMLEGKGEKKREQLEHDQAQARTLLQLQRERVDQQKQSIVEKREWVGSQVLQLQTQLMKQDKLLKQAKDEQLRINIQIAKYEQEIKDKIVEI